MNINKLIQNEIPKRLQRIPSPPKQLFHVGAPLAPILKHKVVAIVGSRKLSRYGEQVTYNLARELAEQGIVIVSGLALGVDAVAHQAALDAGGLTIAVLPGPVDQIYPRSHMPLAEQILAKGGALISEYSERPEAFKSNFVARNRLVAGLADALLITEAAEKSGTLHTARFALDQNREVLAVPGNITSPTSEGTNNLLKVGAHPVTSVNDILHVLEIEPHKLRIKQLLGRNRAEQVVLDLLVQGVSDGNELQIVSQLEVSEFNQTLTMLELSGKVRALGANHWALA